MRSILRLALHAACMMVVLASAARADAPSLPRYTPGDNFTFSDGRTETVIEISGEMIRWRDDLGFSFDQLRNPILPRIRWEREGRRGETTLDALPDLLWPLQPGAAADFVARRQVIEADGVRHDFVQHWSCRVEAPARLQVPAGAFEAWPMVCVRRDDLGQMREERRWWYAPAIGHFAAFEETRDGVPRRRELIAWRRLESSAERDADEASALLQQALETLVSGQELSWTSADRRRKIAVAPIRTFQRDALYCRDYRLSTTQDGAASLEEGTACRSPDAVWRRILKAGTD